MYTWPRWPLEDERTRQALAVAVLAGRWAISGPVSVLPSFLDAAAARVSKLAGRRFAVLTANGSSAIVLALQALGIGPGCRVLTPALTWVGCATAILRTGATPVFVDVGDASPCVPPQLGGMTLEAGVTGAGVIKSADAVLAVHTFASQVDIPALRRGLPGVPIVEDCSHCHGARTADGSALGSLGDLSIFSFQATKLLASGEGGAVVTDDEGMAARLFALSTDSRRLVPTPPADALNRLEPAGTLHGANHAMSEFAGAVLWAQLQKMPELAARRAGGLRFLADRLDPEGGSLVFDEASAASGGFYGVPFLPARCWPSGVARVIEEVRSSCGARLDRVYPPIPSSPLYRPETVSTYHRAQTHSPAENFFPNSARWHREGAVLPHALFLAEKPALTALAEDINRLASRSQPPPRGAPRPAIVERHREVCVVVVTSGKRDTLVDALRSLQEQTYSGPCSVLLMHDHQDRSADRIFDLIAAAALPRAIPVRIVSFTDDGAAGDSAAFSRVARLRNAALGWVNAPLVAFLDDDNAWEPEHLPSLVRLLEATRTLAVHSWRRLLNPDGTPHIPRTFPWLPDPQLAAARFAALSAAGVFGHDSAIVRDRVSIPVGDRDYGMVDMGEWLFDRRLLELIRFDVNWTAGEIGACVGEDDKLVQRLRELLIPVRCTEQATLRYRLGGFTNPFVVTSERIPGRTSWRPVFSDHDLEDSGVRADG